MRLPRKNPRRRTEHLRSLHDTPVRPTQLLRVPAASGSTGSAEPFSLGDKSATRICGVRYEAFQLLGLPRNRFDLCRAHPKSPEKLAVYRIHPSRPEVARFDSPLACLRAVALTPEPERARGELLAPGADSVSHVLPRHAELMALARAASDRNVNVRVSGVMMLDRHPLEVHAEVALQGSNQLAGVAPEIEALALLGRDDELPEPRIAGTLPAREPRPDVDAV